MGGLLWNLMFLTKLICWYVVLLQTTNYEDSNLLIFSVIKIEYQYRDPVTGHVVFYTHKK